MAKIYVTEGLAFEVGPQVGFNVSAKVEGEDGGDSAEIDIQDSVEGTDFAAVGGLSYTLDQGIFFGARYNLGLSNIFSDNGDDSNQNNVFQLSVGYKFN